MSDNREDETSPADGLTSDRAAAIAAAAFPALTPVRADYLGEGCDSVAFVVNDALVFRFPKRDDVAEQLLREVHLLPHVARHVPLPIPVYSHVGQPSRLFPRPFGAYPMLAGTPAIHFEPAVLPRDTIARALAGILSGLHAWDRDDAVQRLIPSTDVDALIKEVRTDALDDFDLVAREAPGRPLEDWHAYISDPPAATDGAEPVVVHGDLAAEHVLFDGATRTVTGVIDWSEIALADAAMDFAGVFHWGGQELMNAVLQLYTGAAATPGTLLRARYLAACRGVCDVGFGIDMKRPEYVRSGVRALELCTR